MTYTVFFKEGQQIFSADNFITGQPIAHQMLLKSTADELSERGTIGHPQATINSKGEWSILVKDGDDVYMYNLFISTFERKDPKKEEKAATKQKERRLVIIDSAGPRDTVGGYHPGYWLPEDFVNFLQDNQRAAFTETVYQIVHNIPSKNYTMNSDRSASINILKPGKTSTIILTCRAGGCNA